MSFARIVFIFILATVIRSQYITRKGSQLFLNDQPFKFSGTNIYWLGLDENVGGVDYPTNFRITDALQTVAEMGGRVVRAHTVGVSTGNPKSFLPALNKFNHTALKSSDFAISTASKLGLRLIVPLTDNYHYYHGGKHDFTTWRNIADENQFYTNQEVISDFKSYISELVNHVNIYTGIARKNDPTIMAWETGNEIKPPAAWTQEIADYIKSVAPNQLVLDGTYGVNQAALSFDSVDMYSNHYYPMKPEQIPIDAKLCAQASKVYYPGEYGWNGDNLNQFLTEIQNNSVAGDTFWSLFPHLDTHGWEQHNDGFSLHFPPGDTPQIAAWALALRQHAYAMRGTPVPKHAVPEAPLVTALASGSIAWRGASGAAKYSVEKSANGSSSWVVICNQCATDNNTPWKDNQITASNFYRVQGFNLDNVAGTYSPVEKLN